MSTTEQSESRSPVVPYVGIDRVIDVLKSMYKNSYKERNLKEMATLLGCSVSNLNNVTPTVALLSLGQVKKGILALTTDGLVFADAVTSNDLEKAKQIVKKNIQYSESLMFVKSLLETRTSLSGDEIGRALAERFKKDWKDLRTIRNFGNSCASILSFGGIGFYYDGMLSLKPATITASSSLYAPEATYKEIIDVLKALHGFERAKISDIAAKLHQKETSLYTNITVCTTLGLIDKESTNVYRLTSSGMKLIDPILDNEKKIEIFRECLLQSPYTSLVSKLRSVGSEISTEQIGDLLAFDLKRNWSDDTKTLYSNKFISWLSNAGIVEKVKPGLYAIESDLKITHTETITDNSKSRTLPDLNSVYEVGRAIGNLESLILEGEKPPFFNDRIVFLKELLSKHEDLKLALDMLTKNFEIAISSNNPAIYKSNVDFVREKIKEKMLTGIDRI